jgi:hypothetical protein
VGCLLLLWVLMQGVLTASYTSRVLATVGSSRLAQWVLMQYGADRSTPVGCCLPLLQLAAGHHGGCVWPDPPGSKLLLPAGEPLCLPMHSVPMQQQLWDSSIGRKSNSCLQLHMQHLASCTVGEHTVASRAN